LIRNKKYKYSTHPEMKKFTLSLLLMLISTGLISQTTRMVMQEEFTSSTCYPCSLVNPDFHTWQTQHPDIYTSIFYHTYWPSPGDDPMYWANPTDNNGRIGYYNITAVPWSIIDGNVFNNEGDFLTWDVIQNRSTTPSPFQIKIRHQLNTAEDSIFVTVLATCKQAVTAPMVAQNAVVEKHIHYTSAPGSNGEKDFYNVMRKMLPGAGGTAMPGSFAVGDYFLMYYGWKLANVVDNFQLGDISFIQNISTKEIYQAANSTTASLPMPFNDDLQVMNVSNYSTMNCSGKISPTVEIRNNGNHNVTSAEIKYQVNGGSLSSYTWTGNLATLKSAVVNLPESEFTPIANNILKVYTIKPNNVSDEYPKNDTATIGIPLSPVIGDHVQIFIKTDNAPGETTWDVKDASGTVIKSGGPYTLAGHMYRESANMTDPGCYTFTIYDSGGNGICCDNGSGVYNLLNAASPPVTFKTGTKFGSSEFTEFSMDVINGIPDPVTTEVKVYPNPSKGTINLSLTVSTQEKVSVALYSTLGKLERTFDEGLLDSGTQEFSLNAEGLAPGLYVMKILAGDEVITRKIALEK
jgi:hypothetical protein